MSEKPNVHPILRALAVILILASLGMAFLPWIDTSVSYSGLLGSLFRSAESVGLAQLCRGEGNLAILLSAALLLICAGIGIACAVHGTESGGVPAFLAALLAFGTVLKSRHWDFGQMGSGAWLCLGFAVGAMLLLSAPALLRALAAGRRARRGQKGETAPCCPACGAVLPEKGRFCPNCGSPCGPEEMKTPPCAACGAPLRPGMAFCPSCGAPVLSQEPPETEPVRRCAFCGAELREEALFCPECGAPVPPAESESPDGT